MGKLGVYKYISFMLLLISTLMAVFTLFGLFGGSSDPASGTAIAMLVYALPYLLGGNVIMLIYWLIRRHWQWLAIPAVPLLCGIPYIGTVYQPGLFNDGETSRSGVKIATYNVAMFGRETSGFKALDILAEMKRQNVDILCIQEYENVSGDKLNSDSYKGYFPYSATGRLETTGFNSALHNMAKNELQGRSIEDNAFIRLVYGNYTRGMAVRARQADMVADLVQTSDYPCIVCGDFNDVPYSYVYKTMLGDLVDGFKECGEGIMRTYDSGKKKVRIDYIFHDPRLEGESYYTKEINYSDHYPVFMKIAF